MPSPREMENRGAPPVENRLENAVIMEVTGSVRPIPVRAQGGSIGKPSDIHTVYNAVKNINQLSQGHREGNI